MARAASRNRMNVGERIIELLYPGDVVCCACGREAVLTEDGVCAECAGALVCAPEKLPCPGVLEGLCAGLVYNEAIESAMHCYKYKQQAWLAPFFASKILIPADWEIDCLVPVPLHPLREWIRTYNQSELLCRALEKRYPLPIRTDLIRRVRYTSQQAKLSAEARRRNLAGAFRANVRTAGLSVVLVDDVTTTHSTLIECATALRHAGARRVYAACACVAGYDSKS